MKNFLRVTVLAICAIFMVANVSAQDNYDDTTMGAIVRYYETAKWAQGSPFNNQCWTDATQQTHAKTGCVPTAFAIIMRHHGFPVEGIGTLKNGQTDVVITDRTYDYSKMPLTNGSGWTAEQQNEVAKLMAHLGHAFGVTFGSGTTSVSIGNTMSERMQKFFNYNYAPVSNQYAGSGQMYDFEEWKKNLKNSLDNGCPVPYAADNKKDGKNDTRHMFVVDGYTENEYFHFNFGWGGGSNGWYKLDDITPTGDDYSWRTTSDGYDSKHQAFFNLMPNTTTYAVTATVNDSNMGTVSINNGTAGSTATANLMQGVTATLTAHPVQGYALASWTKNGVVVGSRNTIQVTVGTDANDYVANFDDAANVLVVKEYTVNPANGSLSGGTSKYSTWTSTDTQPALTLKATNASGAAVYAISALSSSYKAYATAYDSSDKAHTNITYTLSVPEGYVIKDYTMTYIVGTANQISLNGELLNSTGTFELSATPNAQSASFTLSVSTAGQQYVTVKSIDVTVQSEGGSSTPTPDPEPEPVLPITGTEVNATFAGATGFVNQGNTNQVVLPATQTAPAITFSANDAKIGYSTVDGTKYPYLFKGTDFTISVPAPYKIAGYKLTVQGDNFNAGTFTYTVGTQNAAAAMRTAAAARSNTATATISGTTPLSVVATGLNTSEINIGVGSATATTAGIIVKELQLDLVQEAQESEPVYTSSNIRITSNQLMSITKPTHIAVKNLSKTNNWYFAGTTNVANFGNEAVFVWTPKTEGVAGEYYLKTLDGKYLGAAGNNTAISYTEDVANAAVFTTLKPVAGSTGTSKLDKDSDTGDYVDNDNLLVRFMTKYSGGTGDVTTWINVTNTTSPNQPKYYNEGYGMYTAHFVYAVSVDGVAPELPDEQLPTDPLAGKYFRLKTTVNGAAKYLNVGTRSDNSHGNVNMVDLNKSSNDQIFFFEQSGDGYKLKAKSGNYIKCAEWNVNANTTDVNEASVLLFEESGDGYLINWYNTYKGAIKYFNVQTAKGGDYALHPYCDGEKSSAFTWILEEVVYYTVTATAGEGGSVSPSTSTIEKGNNVTLTATANDGYKFIGWYNGETKVSDANPHTFAVTGNINYEARFGELFPDGAYNIYWQADNRGYLAYHGTDYPNEAKLAGVGYSGCQNIHYSVNDVDLVWYLITADDGKRYLFQAATGKFLGANPSVDDNGIANKLSTTEAWPIAIKENTKHTGHYIITTEINGTNSLLCSGCGTAKEQHPVRWLTVNDTNQTDGGAPLQLIPVNNVTVAENVIAFARNVINGKVQTIPNCNDFLNNFKNGKIYYFETSRGVLAALQEGNNLVSTARPNIVENPGMNNPYCQWTVYRSDDNKYYLYNIGKRMFMGTTTTNNGAIPFTETPVNDGLVFKAATKNGYPIMFTCNTSTGAVNHSTHINHEYGLVYWKDGWNELNDDGNCHKVTLIGELDNTELQHIADAVAKVNTYFITVTAGNGGSAFIGTETSTTVEHGSSVTLTAEANEGYHFVNWTKDGVEVSTEANYTIDSVTADGEYVANFAINTYAITATANPGTGGSASVSAATVEHGGETILTATPNAGYYFVNWTKGTEEVSSENPYTINSVTSDAEYIANFEQIVANVTLNDIQGNTYKVTLSGLTGEVNTETLAAKLKTEYPFIEELGIEPKLTTDGASYTYTNTVKLKFKVSNPASEETDNLWHNIYYPTNTNGRPNYLSASTTETTLVEMVNDGTYNYGANPTYNTKGGNPNIAWAIYNVNNSFEFIFKNELTGKYIKVESIASSDAQNVEFVEKAEATAFTFLGDAGTYNGDYALVAKIGEEAGYLCSTSPSYGYATYHDSNTHQGAWMKIQEADYTDFIRALDERLLRFNIGNGYYLITDEFQIMIDSLVYNKEQIRLNQFNTYFDAIDKAFKTWPKISLTITPENKGTTNIGGEENVVLKYVPTGDLTIEAVPVEGYHFVKWIDGTNEVETAAYTKNISGGKDDVIALTAEFAINIYDINVTAGEGGNASASATTAEHGSEVTLTAVANAGYEFVNWTKGGEVVSNNTNYTFVATANGEYVANFRQIVNCIVTVTATTIGGENGGTVKVAVGTTESNESLVVNKDTNVTFTATTAGTNYRFAGWYNENDECVSTDASYSTTITANTTYNAKFIKQVDVRIELIKNGYAFAHIGDEATLTHKVFDYGTTVDIHAVSYSADAIFAYWTLDGAKLSQDADYSFVAEEDSYYFVANFNYKAYIAVVAGDNGTAYIGSEGVTRFEMATGNTVTITAKAESGYVFDHWALMDGSSDEGTTVSTSAVYTLTLNANPNMTVTYKAFFRQITALEDGKAYRIAGKMSDGTLRYIYRDGQNLKWSTTKDETTKSIFIAQSDFNGSLNLISAVGDYGWNYDGDLSHSYATLKTADGSKDGTFTLYAVDGDNMRSYNAYGTSTSNDLNFNTGTYIRKENANGNCTDMVFEEIPFAFQVSVANGSNAKLGTVNLPFATTVPEGVKVYGVDHSEDDKVYMAELELTNNVLPAKTPVLVEAEKAGKFGFAPAPASAAVETGFAGTLEAKDIPATTNAYILSYKGDGTHIMLYKLSSTSRKINANKAYFIEATGKASALQFVFGETTDIEDMEGENGEIEAIYDLQGRKLSEITEPGFYIVNGKKIFVK